MLEGSSSQVKIINFCEKKLVVYKQNKDKKSAVALSQKSPLSVFFFTEKKF